VLIFGNISIACAKECINVKVKVEVSDKIAGGYLRGTTYLRTPLFGMIPVVTLFVVCAGAVILTVRQTNRISVVGLHTAFCIPSRLYSLSRRRQRGDLIETYKILRNIEDID